MMNELIKKYNKQKTEYQKELAEKIKKDEITVDAFNNNNNQIYYKIRGFKYGDFTVKSYVLLAETDRYGTDTFDRYTDNVKIMFYNSQEKVKLQDFPMNVPVGKLSTVVDSVGFKKFLKTSGLGSDLHKLKLEYVKNKLKRVQSTIKDIELDNYIFKGVTQWS